jgi:hypothetical protein
MAMKSTALQEIEKHLPALSAEENLWLIEQLVQHLRDRQHRQQQEEEALDALAADPDIQREIREIAEEFAGTEEDGMEGL